MTEEIKTQEEQKNTVATVGMWFSIIGLVLLITVIFAWFWIPLLLLWFILWIIGLFYKPRGKARVAVCIPLVVFIAFVSIACYLWNSVKTPVNEFMDWVKPQFEQFEDDENFDGDRFGDLLQIEINKLTNDKTDEDRENMFESSTGSNSLEKGAYMLSSMLKQSMEAALEKYNNGELPEFDEDVNNIIDVDIDVNSDEDDEDTNTNEEDDSENEPVEQEEVTVAQPKKSNNGTFTQSEKNDIEQVLDILE